MTKFKLYIQALILVLIEIIKFKLYHSLKNNWHIKQ